MEANIDKDKLKVLVIDDAKYNTRLIKKFENRKPYEPADPKKIISFLPGTITKISVTEGMKVNKGDELLIFEAMKMKNHFNSPRSGKIKKIHVNVGDRVAKNQLMIEFDK